MANLPLKNYIPFLGSTTFIQADEIAPGAVSPVVSVMGTVAGTNTYTLTVSTTISALSVGFTVHGVFTNANTAAATLNVNGLGAKSIKKAVSTNLAAGDITAGSARVLVYDGTNFQLINVA